MCGEREREMRREMRRDEVTDKSLLSRIDIDDSSHAHTIPGPQLFRGFSPNLLDPKRTGPCVSRHAHPPLSTLNRLNFAQGNECHGCIDQHTLATKVYALMQRLQKGWPGHHNCNAITPSARDAMHAGVTNRDNSTGIAKSNSSVFIV
ncbi:unnamed protein product [Symbiodinium natans]|uniref:Uncharacterized protein n=1 Tax=Symbiodinium natans TaxID=878477 RepID=A0A812V1N4_9DINO|nr:unnamed protein product [Symbiodinium natans]